MVEEQKKDTRPRVCVIGGGISGLLAIRHIKDVADITAFEAKSNVGGLWF